MKKYGIETIMVIILIVAVIVSFCTGNSAELKTVFSYCFIVYFGVRLTYCFFIKAREIRYSGIKDRLLKIADNRKKLKQISILVFFLGFAAYGYVFNNFVPSHDGIMTITVDQDWQDALGRFLERYYILLRGRVDAPWLIGLITLLFVIASVYFTTEIFEIDNTTGIFVITSLFTLNNTFVLLAGVYIYTMDIYALALLFAILSVYFYKKEYESLLGILLPAFFIFLSLGLYQSYFAVSLSLFAVVIIHCLMTEETDIISFLRMAFRMIIVVLLGVVLYLSVMKVLNIELVKDNYNSFSNVFNLSLLEIAHLVPKCYIDFLKYFFYSKPYSEHVFNVVNLLILVVGIISYIRFFIRECDMIKKVLLLMTICIFPLIANCMYILNVGVIHYLMIFSYQIFYVLLLMPVLCIKNTKIDEYRGIDIVTVCLAAILCVLIIRFSNGLYYYKTLVAGAYMTTMTNIVYDIERNFDFDSNKTEIVIMGSPSEAISTQFSADEYYVQYPVGKIITYDDVFYGYFVNLLGRDYRFNYSEDLMEEIAGRNEFKEMPKYPKEGYIQTIDNYLVIKFDNPGNSD